MYLKLKGESWQKGKRAYVVKKVKEGDQWVEKWTSFKKKKFYRKRDAETEFLTWLKIHSDKSEKSITFDELEDPFWVWYRTGHSEFTTEHAKINHWVHVKKEFKGEKIEDITAARVEAYKAKYPALSIPTWKNRLTLLKQFIKYAEIHGFKVSNPFATIKIKQKKVHEYPPKAPSREDVKLLLERMKRHSDRHHYFTALCLKFTGMRPIEFARLKKEDIIEGKFRVFAKNKYRLIPIHPELQSALKDLPIGGYHHKSFRQALQRTCRALKWARTHITPYSFRHYFGTELLRKTKNLRLVSQAMGHTSLEMTARYAWVLDEDQKAGIDMLD